MQQFEPMWITGIRSQVGFTDSSQTEPFVKICVFINSLY